MIEKLKKIQWLTNTRDQLKEIISYIKRDSPQNADKVKKAIIGRISGLPLNPEKFLLININFKIPITHIVLLNYIISAFLTLLMNS